MFSPVIRTFLATLIIAGFSFTTRAMSEEVIHSFHSLVEVASNGNLTVTETIEVEARGRQIKRGIFRDFPHFSTFFSFFALFRDFPVFLFLFVFFWCLVSIRFIGCVI